MLLWIAGDPHGRLHRMYSSDISAFEGELRLPFDVVLHVGDFGIWPNASAHDWATGDTTAPASALPSAPEIGLKPGRGLTDSIV